MSTTSQCMESSISNLQATPLKKRIVKINSSYTDKITESNTTENKVTDQDIINNTQETSIQCSSTKEDKIDEKDLRTEATPNTLISTDISGNKETEHNDNIKNNLGSANTSFTKVSNMHSTPKKTGESLHSFDNTNSNKKVDDMSDKNIFSLCLRELQDLLQTPPKKIEKSLQSDTVVPTNGNLEKINDNDYKQLCDTMQSELCNSENLNVMEAVDFLHDDLLNTAINVEDTKESDILLSSIPDINTLQYIDEGLADLKEDPLTDPLSISDHEEKDDSAFTDSDSKPLALRRSSRVSKRLTENYGDNFKRKRYKLNPEEKCILKELEDVEEGEDLPLSIIKQLGSLCIELVHEVPPQHKVEATGAHPTTTEEKNLIRQYGPLRKGSYSPTEDKIITQNWNTFCKLHNWNPKNVEPFLNWRHKGKYYIHDLRERQKFVQFLANGLSWRTLYSVHSRFKVLYCTKITNARYTSKEDRKILTYIRNEYLDSRPTKYVELAKLLRRTSRSVSKRYRHLQGTQTKQFQVKWTLPLIKKFIKKLLSVTKSDDVEELKHIALPMPVWHEMEGKLNIDGNVLKIFWQHQLHLQLFSTRPIYLNNIKIQLIEYMYKKGISSTREIIWPNVAQYFDGATAVFLCKIFFYLVQECEIKNTDNFADVVEYLYHKKIPEIRDAPTDKFLPKIVYKNGQIDVSNSEDDTIDTNTVACEADCDTDDI